VIDRVLDRPELHDLQQADYFLDDRKIVIEVKSFTENRTRATQAVIDKWRRRRDWPLFHGELGLATVLNRHPRRDDVVREIANAMTKSAKAAFEKGNRQIRDTKRFFNLPNAMGVLLFLNDGVDLLDPSVLGRTFAEQIRRRDADGGRRFESVDSVVIISWAHAVADEHGTELMPVFWCSADTLTEAEQEQSFERWLLVKWASFLDRPITHGGELKSEADLDSLRLRGKRSPDVLDGDAQWADE
jgi:hypothetical protein